jgi:hypothetical protein
VENVGQLQGVEKVEGRDIYRLKLTMRGGQVRAAPLGRHADLLGDENRGGSPDVWMVRSGTWRFFSRLQERERLDEDSPRARNDRARGQAISENDRRKRCGER